MASHSSFLRIGIDIGGTFTDFVLFDPATSKIRTFKVLSTPQDPAQAVLDGLLQAELLPGQGQTAGLEAPIQVVHGSTVATNALLERKGARTALVTTRGFRDILQIGRQNRPALYDWFADPPVPLVPTDLSFEVDERVDAHGAVLIALQRSQVEALVPELARCGVESVAVCLLFSFLHPEHEQFIAQFLRAAGFSVSPSCEVLPEYREYERMSTTTINAYVSPVLDRYLSHLENALQPEEAGYTPSRLRVMQSNGGAISVAEARRSGVHCILSGPAGGVVGAQTVASLATGREKPGSGQGKPGLMVITFDMGGTSTDVSLILDTPLLTTEATVDGLPIRIPVLDIHTIGAGGGSIASIDLGGALRVGPQSAGADPGPACYGRVDPAREPERVFPTVTDANLVLGRLEPDLFLGGRMPLNVAYARWALQRLGHQIGLSPVQAALGVVQVTNAHMERALRVISVERGHDPRDFLLLSFGGAGGLHAANLARHLGIPRLLVSPYASTLSALGMLAADVIKDYTQTVMLPGETQTKVLKNYFSRLVERGRKELLAEGLPAGEISLHPALDMRYQGQSYELQVAWTGSSAQALADFHASHHVAYGYAHPASPVEIVNLRLRAVGRIPPLPVPVLPKGVTDPSPALLGYRPVYLDDGKPASLPFYRGEALQPGNQFAGPAIVVRSDTTILIGTADRAEVDAYQNLWVDVS